jgi:hypothetical protein
MSDTDGDTTEEYLKNTHDTYRLFYTVLLTIGIGQGFTTVLDRLGSAPLTEIIREIHILLIFSAFLLIVFRFFLGGTRYLDATYLEVPFDDIRASKVSSQHFRALDILLLFFDAGVIILLGSLITQPRRFFVVFAILLVVDAIWALGTSYHVEEMREDGEITPQVKWGINNGGHFLLVTIALTWFGLPALLMLSYTNSAFDLYCTFDTYFPQL